MLDAEQRAELLSVARRRLERHFDSGQPSVEVSDPALLRPAGAFVSLHRRAPTAGAPRLRGCIGTFEERDPLVDTVERMTIAAATQDPRFSAVRAEELTELAIEISVLSPRRRVSAEEVVVGRHGVFITLGSRRGVLLPQVATEHGWDRQTFLEHTCQKAGLPRDTWRDAQTQIEVFSAQVFGEAH
ncbi:MAG: AMMECR1 domain-containing protein [Proteobacteria bacterium]|nr:MAG: AMMECR1 domain-containing protein [Pseudomonadota bacterium]PIE19011.1 MAG: AMMECR1 domain-containing protein [Pseudomonadota bacterium]